MRAVREGSLRLVTSSLARPRPAPGSQSLLLAAHCTPRLTRALLQLSLGCRSDMRIRVLRVMGRVPPLAFATRSPVLRSRFHCLGAGSGLDCVLPVWPFGRAGYTFALWLRLEGDQPPASDRELRPALLRVASQRGDVEVAVCVRERNLVIEIRTGVGERVLRAPPSARPLGRDAGECDAGAQRRPGACHAPRLHAQAPR